MGNGLPTGEVLCSNRVTNPSIAIRPLMSSRPDAKMNFPFLGTPLRVGSIVATMKSSDTKAIEPWYDCTCWNTFLPVLYANAKADTIPNIVSLQLAQLCQQLQQNVWPDSKVSDDSGRDGCDDYTPMQRHCKHVQHRSIDTFWQLNDLHICMQRIAGY